MKAGKHSKVVIRMHVDDQWINKKIDGHGGSYSCNSVDGLALIGYIGHKNAVQVSGYNIILYFRYLKRKLSKKMREWHKILNV